MPLLNITNLLTTIGIHQKWKTGKKYFLGDSGCQLPRDALTLGSPSELNVSILLRGLVKRAPIMAFQIFQPLLVLQPMAFLTNSLLVLSHIVDICFQMFACLYLPFLFLLYTSCGS
jgi:hypothetical protein